MNTDFIVRGSGKPLRQFIFSEDLANIILFILFNSNEDNTIISVSENDEISIGDVAKIIAKYFDYDNRLIFDTNYSDGQYKKTVTNKKLKQMYSNLNTDLIFTRIEEGIKKTIEWFIISTENKLV